MTMRIFVYGDHAVLDGEKHSLCGRVWVSDHGHVERDAPATCPDCERRYIRLAAAEADLDPKTSAEARRELRARRAALSSPVDRIAFDNRWVGGLPIGLILLAFEKDDAEPASKRRAS